MAKNKPVLTPEELEAKNARKAEKNKIFGETFVKSLAILMSIVLVYSIVYIAFGQGTTIEQKIVTQGSSNTSGGSSSSSSSSSSSNSSSSSDSSASSDSNSSSDSSSSSSSEAGEVAKLINSATKAAVDAKAGYDWERHCTVENIDVGSATSTLNKIIQGVDSSADLNSVVGGFLGRGDQKQTCPKGQTLDTMDVQKDDGTMGKLYHGSSYTLKATNLQAGDIQNLTVNGDTYEFTIPDSTNPDRNGNNALSRFTNDIVIQSEVDAEIKSYVSVVTVNSVTANYKNIKVKAVITDGKLQSLEYSYAADAEIQLKAIVSITGTGNLNANAKYSNFVY